MTAARKRIAAAAVAVAMIGGAHVAHAAMQEDDPGWNCATMGNRICGPVHATIYKRGRYGDGIPDPITAICMRDASGRPIACTRPDRGSTVRIVLEP